MPNMMLIVDHQDINNKGPGKYADTDGRFRRPASKFRGFISQHADAEFPAQKDRYVLYINFGCPWAHRTNIVRSIKGLEDIIQLAVTGLELGKDGWVFDGSEGSQETDPLYAFKNLRQLYEKADPEYQGRYTVPVLWDKQRETIVNNESSEIIRMMYNGFDELLPPELRQGGPCGAFLPEKLRADIEEMNEWVYNTVNNGVYKTGFAATQVAYEENLIPLFASLDRLEEHLSQPGHSPYLFGERITEADIRLYPTLIRFDGKFLSLLHHTMNPVFGFAMVLTIVTTVAYHTSFRCNLKMIRHDYPRLHDWLRRLYWDTSQRTNGGAFKKTTYFTAIKRGYANAQKATVVPKGPLPDIMPLDESNANGN